MRRRSKAPSSPGFGCGPWRRANHRMGAIIPSKTQSTRPGDLNLPSATPARVSPARGRHYVHAVVTRTAARGSGEDQVLNRYDHRSAPGEAEIRYLDGDFRVIRPGAFVRCAVTGVAIPLEELKYWSVERQEPYASPDAVLKALYPGRVRA